MVSVLMVFRATCANLEGIFCDPAAWEYNDHSKHSTCDIRPLYDGRQQMTNETPHNVLRPTFRQRNS